jgi:2Fe-2S ferredoxin
MAQLNVVLRNGEERAIEGEAGLSVMEVIREAGIGELLALCGGCLSCATCHVHLDPDWMDRVPPADVDEEDLLELADDRDDTSRLSCQIVWGPELDGLTVRIAAE